MHFVVYICGKICPLEKSINHKINFFFFIDLCLAGIS